MRYFVIVALTLGLLCLPLAAQENEYPRAEIFGGYQFSHLGGTVNGTSGSVNANGWNASVTGNATRWLGVTADFSGAYKTVSGVSANMYTYTFGPVVSLNHEGVVNPFVHALFGGARMGASLSGVGSGSTNGFTMMFGGGVDAKVHKNFAVRVGQIDWVYYRFSGIGLSKSMRFSTGVVLRF